MTAMTAATLDLLSGGRAPIGLGVSGPQVSEGWHGVRFDAPVSGPANTSTSCVWPSTARQSNTPVATTSCPSRTGPERPFLTVRRVRPRIPIYLAAIGPKNLELAGEVADGGLAIFFSPDQAETSLSRLRAGARPGGARG